MSWREKIVSWWKCSLRSSWWGYNREIGKVAEGEDILFLIQRGDTTHYIVLSNGEKVEKAPQKPLIYL